MNSFNIALRNFKNNIRAYGLHIGAMIFSVMIYYNFAALKHNPEVLKAQSVSHKAAATSQSAGFLLLVFLMFFIWYSSTFFLNQRKKEIGLYTFMGISNSRIGIIFAIETLIMGFVSLVLGLLSGVLVGKLFMMLLARVALLNVRIEFFISFKGIVETIIVFLAIFILTSMKEFIDIARSKPIDLFNAAKKEEKLPGINYFKAAVSILLIGLGYYCSSTAFDTKFFSSILMAVVLVVWGTYWLFGSFIPWAVRFLLGKKSILYNGVNIVSLSNIAFRIRRNYKTLATIAVLVTTTITAFGTVTSIKYYIDKSQSVGFPYSFSYTSDDITLKEKVREKIKNSTHAILMEKEAKFLLIDKFDTDFMTYQKDMAAVSFTEFAAISRDLSVRNAESLIEKVRPGRGETLYIEKPSVVIGINNDMPGSNINMSGYDFVVKDAVKTPLFGNGLPKAVFVITDEDYELLKSKYNEYVFNGIIVDRAEETSDLASDLSEIVPVGQNLFSYVRIYKERLEFIGIIYFMGAFLALVFVIATGSIMYFKLLSEALEDKAKYEVLMKIGMSEDEVFKAVSKQVGFSFALPLIVGSVHSIAAIRVLQRLMNFNLFIPTIVSIMVFTGVYALFYAVTTRKFSKIV